MGVNAHTARPIDRSPPAGVASEDVGDEQSSLYWTQDAPLFKDTCHADVIPFGDEEDTGSRRSEDCVLGAGLQGNVREGHAAIPLLPCLVVFLGTCCIGLNELHHIIT